MDNRPTVEAPDDDPYLWLEEVEGEQANAWTAKQSARTLARVADASYDADRAALLDVLDRPDRIPHVSRIRGLFYNFWRDAAHTRGIWRRTTFASYLSGEPNWELLLDLDALAATEAEDWVWQGVDLLPSDPDRVLVSLSRGGSDASVVREFDLGTGGFVPDGFVLPEAKGGTEWVDRDTLLLMSALGGATDSGYARTVRRWHRGTDPSDAPVIFEVGQHEMGAVAQYDRQADRVAFIAQLGFYDTRVSIGTIDGPVRMLDLPTDMGMLWHRGWLVLRTRQPWEVADRTYAPDTLLGIGFDAFLEGERAFKVLFEASPRRALRQFSWVRDTLIVAVLDELHPEFLLFSPGDDWRLERLDRLPSVGTVDVWSPDADPEVATGELFAVTQTPIDPPTLLLTDTHSAAPTILRRAPASFDPAGAVVTQHEATSSDGERIPYVQVGPAVETGEAPVFMTGYGGFRVPTLPTYAPRAGKLWVEKGGTFVSASLRGGGEFGTWWHEAGRRANKILSHDDFAAVAADLVRRGVTRPGRIAAEGGSNGGLLIANMLTRYPERFGALFCTIPLVDMRRYHRLLAGASWMAEYGDPDAAEDWAFIRTMSAYHTAEPGRPYPPILIATTRRDDRVHPGHARKFAAKLQAMGYDALFYEPAAGGHGYGKDNAEVASFAALGMRFLRQAIGWS